MVSPRQMSAVASIDTARFGGPTKADERDTTVGTSVSELLGANSNRVMAIITNNGSAEVRWSLKSSVTTTTGHRIAAGSTLVLSAFDDGELVALRIYAISGSADQALTVTEVTRAHIVG